MNLRKIDDRPAQPESKEILLCSVVQNETLRLPHFLDYYRKLGIDRFYFIDNASTDGTAELLLNEPDCHVFYTDEDYTQNSWGMNWVNSLLDEYAKGHWVAVLDADELLVYPECETRYLAELTQRLDSQQKLALPTFLLDMYSDKPIAETNYQQGQPLIDICPYFDGDGYQRSRTYRRLNRIPVIGKCLARRLGKAIPKRGGPRARVLWSDQNKGNPPFLGKVPLIKWQSGFWYSNSTHGVNGLDRHDMARFSGALLHFKFLQDSAIRAAAEAAKTGHWNGGVEYKTYNQAFENNPNLGFYYPGSIRYRDSQQLVDLGLIIKPRRMWQ